jgi:hypothetical protein
MTRYISHENQELLWRLLNQSPVFCHHSEAVKIKLFKETVEKNYNSQIIKDMDYTKLQELNKKTLVEIISRITPKEKTEVPTSENLSYNDHTGIVIPDVQDLALQEEFQQQQTLKTQHHRQHTVVETSEECAIREFEQRQREYEMMIAKPDIPDAQSMFQEAGGEEEEVIRNMDELLQQYQSQRDTDVLIIAPTVEKESPTVPISLTYNVLQDRIQLLETRLGELECRVHNSENSEMKKND